MQEGPRRHDIAVEEMTAGAAARYVDSLARLLVAVVNAGGSLGFVAPLSLHEAVEYWTAVVSEVSAGTARLLIALRDDQVVGTVQLHPSPWPDGGHRAELAKLMVAPPARRSGIASRLMDEIERLAASSGRTLLVLNTRVDDPSERLYRQRGYTRFGIVPSYLSDGSRLYDKSYWYRHLVPPARLATGRGDRA